MPVSQANLQATLSWALTRANTGFGNTGQGSDSQVFNLTGLNTATFNQIYNHQFSIASAGTATIDLTSLTNLVNESFSFGHVLTIFVEVAGSACTIGPSASNPFQWFWGGLTQTISINPNGFFAWSDGPGATGTAPSGTHKKLDIVNTGGTTATVTISVLGSTT